MENPLKPGIGYQIVLGSAPATILRVTCIQVKDQYACVVETGTVNPSYWINTNWIMQINEGGV